MRMSADPAEPAEERPGPIRVVPNLLTSVRLALGVAFPFIPAGSRWAALVAAAATEFLDGQLARLFRVPSAIGRLLDPIADKVFVVSVLTTLLVEGTVSPWQLFLVLSRDIVVMAGALWLAARRGISALRKLPPSLLGKLATAAQFLFLFAVVATREVSLALLTVVSALGAAAAIHYAMRFR
jgi:phosphatidylglycerophosphate synthase